MNAEGRVEEIVFLCQANSAVHLLRPVAVADSDDGPHPSLARPHNHLLAIGVELATIKMCVRIYEH